MTVNADIPVPGLPRLELLKALGDNTRYAIYRELAASPVPLATAELAERLDLHPNTVRPHLERMREVGLVAVEADARGGVGRPQHRYSPAADAPSFGFEPPVMPLLAGAMVQVARRLGGNAEDTAAAGRTQGRADAERYAAAPSALEALVAELDRLGFDPDVSDGDDADTAVVAFGRCPFGDLSTIDPEIVCGLHRGLVEGFVEAMGDAEVREFCNAAHRNPCRVAVATR
jgi:predicted ArsR family transcriptional regulator